MTTPFSKEELDGFREAAQSLKLYRRAELPGVGSEALIEKLYVDPLPNDHVLHTILKESTTFIIGRKGTGKSTIFQRAQHELRKLTYVTSAYVDIKTVYEASQSDPDLMVQVAAMEGALPEASLERLLLHRAFLAAVIKSIRDEIRKRIDTTIWKKFKRAFLGASLDELFEGLDALLHEAERSNFESVLGTYAQKSKIASTQKQDGDSSSSLKATLSNAPSVNAGLDVSRSYTETSSDELEYVDVLMRSFEIKNYIIRLKELLEKFKIEKLYVFIDDFSELPPQAMQVVVDVLLAPLNNWSDELVKFKIAAYPGRIYYGQIDKSKVDEINLICMRCTEPAI